MHIFQAKITKSVTKQVRDYEPIRVECELHMQLDAKDNFDESMQHLIEMVDAGVDAGHQTGDPSMSIVQAAAPKQVAAAKPPALPKSDETPAEKPKRRRRTKAEMEAARAAEAEAAKVNEQIDQAKETAAATADADDVLGLDTDFGDMDGDDNGEEILMDEPAVPIDEETVMQAVNKAVKAIKPVGIKGVLSKFKASRVGEIAPEDRPAFMMELQSKCKDAGVDLSL